MEKRTKKILEYMPLVKKIAKGMLGVSDRAIEIGDLINSGVIGLCKAYDSFNESVGVSFGTYAKVRIRGAIYEWLRSVDWATRDLRKSIRDGSVEITHTPLDQVSQSLVFGGVSPIQHTENSEIKDDILDLDERKKTVLVCRYYKDMKFKDIGMLLGVTKSRACQIHSEALNILREKYDR